MKSWIALWLIVAALFLVTDVIWLKWIGRAFYTAEIGPLLRTPPNFLAAALFYLLYVTGIVVFVVPSSALAQPIGQTALLAAFFGLVCYGTFDLTSLAVLKGFTVRIAVIDMLWGTFATTATAVLAILIARILPIGIIAAN